MPEGEEEKQETENLFEKIMKENFRNLVIEIYMQTQEGQSPKQDGFKEAHSRHIIITLPKTKEKERVLKQQEKGRELPTKEFP